MTGVSIEIPYLHIKYNKPKHTGNGIENGTAISDDSQQTFKCLLLFCF